MITAIKRLLTTRRALQSDTIDSLRRDVIRLRTAKNAAEAKTRLAVMDKVAASIALTQAEDRLRRIAAMETAYANATVKRMAKVAREGSKREAEKVSA